MSEEYITLMAAAEYLGVSRDKMSRMVRDGKIEALENPLDNRQRLIAKSQLDALKLKGLVVKKAKPVKVYRLESDELVMLKQAIAESDLEDEQGIIITTEEIEQMVAEIVATRQKASA